MSSLLRLPAPKLPAPPPYTSIKKALMKDDRGFQTSKLGSGTFGEVHLADVIIKGKRIPNVVVKQMTYDPNRAKSIQRELDILREVQNSPYTVHMISASMNPATQKFEIIMEYLYKIDLDKVMPYAFKAATIKHLLHGLAWIHSKGIVHGDIKLENIMLRKFSDGSSVPVFTDFGLSCLEPKWTCFGTGTPRYMHPDLLGTLWSKQAKIPVNQMQVNVVESREYDLYALGVALWELMMNETFYVEELIQEATVADLDPNHWPEFKKQHAKMVDLAKRDLKNTFPFANQKPFVDVISDMLSINAGTKFTAANLAQRLP